MRPRRAFSWMASILLALALALLPLAGCSEGYTEERESSPIAALDGVGQSASSDEEKAPAKDSSSQAQAPTSTSAERADTSGTPEQPQAPPAAAASVSEDGTYTSPDEVALYIHTYGHLPSNFISKTKARKAGWESKKGNLDEVCPGKSIGGSTYYNEGWDGEELLPEAPGRTWKECDVNYHGGYRGAERLVFSNDGLIFYTNDHYKTFTQLY